MGSILMSSFREKIIPKLRGTGDYRPNYPFFTQVNHLISTTTRDAATTRVEQTILDFHFQNKS